MKIEAAEVRRIAMLAHLELDEHDIARMQEELTTILDYIDQLPLLEGTADVAPAVTPVREDVVAPSLPVERFAGNAAEFEEGLFVVPRVIGE